MRVKEPGEVGLMISGVARWNVDLLHFDPETRPWRVGCQTIVPEPGLVRYSVSLRAVVIGPKATEAARCGVYRDLHQVNRLLMCKTRFIH